MRRSLKYGLYGAVLAGLVAAPVVLNTSDKSVELVVDGHAHTVSTTAGDVTQVLADHGYTLTAHDIVAPSAHAPVRDDMRVVLRRGRLLHLSVDGQQRDVWTTAPTVQVALGQLGYTTSDFVSVSRSRRLPLRPSDMTIRTPHTVTVQHDGSAAHVTTTSPTVGALLTELNLTVGTGDSISEPVSATLEQGAVIRIVRAGEKTTTKKQTVGYRTVRTADPSLAMGKTKVTQHGNDGTQQVTYSVLHVDGRVVKSVIATRTLRAPMNRIIAVGIKTAKQAAVADTHPYFGPPTPESAKEIARVLLAKRGWGSDSEFSCLDNMWTRESGWSTDAENSGSGAYGIPQSLPGSKMAAYGPDWQTNATTQIKWGLAYIAERYGTPCDAWSFWQAHDYY